MPQFGNLMALNHSCPRDLFGYGPETPAPQWPNQAKVAVQFVLNYEEGGENCVLYGDPHSESYLWEIVGAPGLTGVRNMNIESIYEYGSRSGVWRILALFREHRLPLTVYAVGMALERNPTVAARMLADGHEIATHGYRWIDYQYVGEETERAHLQKAIEIQQQLTGSRPLGCYIGRISPNTRRIVAEEGGFLYNSDVYNDDLPYWELHGEKPLLLVPYTLDVNDMKFGTAQGFNTGEDFFDYARAAFDTLYKKAVDKFKKDGNLEEYKENIKRLDFIQDVFKVRKSIFPEGDLDYLGKFKIKERKGDKPKKKGFTQSIKEGFNDIKEYFN